VIVRIGKKAGFCGILCEVNGEETEMPLHKLGVKRPKRPAPVRQPKQEDVVIFTSFDGTMREVGDLPMPIGEVTALMSEQTLSQIWGSEKEATDCQNMYEERRYLPN